MAKKIISLFSGAGGLDIGLRLAGFQTAVMVDADSSCCRTLRRNMPDVPVLEGDIRKIPTSAMLDAAGLVPGEAALVVGGPPCQSYSLAGKRMGLDDPRGRLILEFVRVVREALPTAFIMENVRGLTSWSGGAALNALLEELSQPVEYEGAICRYRAEWKVLDAARHGVPQRRERLFVVGNRLGKKFTFPAPTRFMPGAVPQLPGSPPLCATVGEALAGLPPAKEPSEAAKRTAETIAARRAKYGY